MIKQILRAILSVFLAFIVSDIAFADELRMASAGDLADLSLEELMNVRVTTASLASEKVSTAPATMKVVTRRQIQERGYRNLEDLMKDLPGFNIQDHQSPSDNDVAVRGVTGNNKLLILMDSVRINAATNSNAVPIRDNYPLYNAKQVEILYGPASAIYGADAMNGVINIITRDGADVDGLTATIEGGEFNYKRAEFFGGKKFSDNIALTMGGHFLDSKNPDLSKTFSEYNLTDLMVGNTVFESASQRSGYGGPSHGYSAYAKLEAGESWRAGFLRSYTEVPSTAGGKQSTTDWDGNPYIGHQQTDLYAKWHGHVGENTEGDFDASYNLYEMTPGSRYVNSITNFQSGYQYEKGERYHLEPRLTWSEGKNSVVAGVSAEWFSSIPLTTDLSHPYDTSLSPSQQNFYHFGTNNTLPVAIYQLNYQNQSLYLQWKYALSDKLSSTLGVRADQNSEYGANINPRLGLVYQSTDAVTFKAMVGQAFLAPAPMQLLRYFGTFSGTTNSQGLYISSFFRVPNPGLKPEKVTTFEIGADIKPARETDLQFNLFYSKVSDMILSATTPTVQSNFVPGGTISYTEWSVNLGEINAYGFDMSADHKFIMGDSWVDSWFNASYVNGELKNPATGVVISLPQTSNVDFNAGLTYNKGERLIITPSLRWVGETNTYTRSPSSPDFGKKAPTYVDTSLYAEYKIIKDKFSIFTRVTNLLDEKIYNVSGGSGNNLTLNPQNPRWIMFGLKYQF
jgi:outer membrane receptor for ferrienterochelin and colicin